MPGYNLRGRKLVTVAVDPDVLDLLIPGTLDELRQEAYRKAADHTRSEYIAGKLGPIIEELWQELLNWREQNDGWFIQLPETHETRSEAIS
jgi:hypothetical protein